MIILLVSFQSPSVEIEMKMYLLACTEKTVSLSLGGGVAYEWILLSENTIRFVTTQEVHLAFDWITQSCHTARVKNAATGAAI